MSSFSSIMRRVFVQGQDWTKDDAMDAILYVRLLVAMLTGITCGVLGSQGLYVFLGFLGLSYSVGRIWMTYHDLTEEAFGGSIDKPEGPTLHFEGFPQSIPMFVLCWVVSFTMTQS